MSPHENFPVPGEALVLTLFPRAFLSLTKTSRSSITFTYRGAARTFIYMTDPRL